MNNFDKLKTFVLSFPNRVQTIEFSHNISYNTDLKNEIKNTTSYKELVGVFLDHDVIDEFEYMLTQFFKN